MSDTFWLKIMALGCLTVLLAIALIEVPGQREIWVSLLGLFSLVLGGPSAAQAIQRRLH